MSQQSLTNEQIRIIGSLIEKSITTPDLYPLSLKSLQNACNQKSSRDPITIFSLSELQLVLDELIQNNLVIDTSGFNSKTAKYQHRFCNTEFSDIQFNEKELAIICLFMLRGPQTSGELRSRAARLYAFKDLSEVEETLQSLISMSGGPYIQALPKVPGKREIRYIHLFAEYSVVNATEKPTEDNDALIMRLKRRIKELEEQVSDLQKRIQ
jgi:uncharacterized protein